MGQIALPRGGVDKSLVESVAFGDGIRLRLENEKVIALDYKNDGGRGRNIVKGDEASINYFPVSDKSPVKTVVLTVKRDGCEVFRDNISADRIITPLSTISFFDS